VISGEPKQAVADTPYLRRFPGPMSGLAAALLADLKFVDCGSLDVLVYCQDDLAAAALREDPFESAHDLRVELRPGAIPQFLERLLDPQGRTVRTVGRHRAVCVTRRDDP